MIRRHIGLAALLLSGSIASAAADPGPASLLIIDTQTTEPYISVRVGMLDELKRRGYVEGKTLSVTIYSMGNYGRTAENIWRYRDHPYSAVFLNGTLAAQSFDAIAKAEPATNFVFAAVTDPVGLGLIDDFGKPPSRNITGVSFPVPPAQRLRFLMRVMPSAHRLGLVYGVMQQSESYRRWLDDLLAHDPEFKTLTILYRAIDFIPGEGGTTRMVEQAASAMHEIDDQVDVFLTPNDQMGANPIFSSEAAKATTKPLLGLIRADVGNGATMAIFPNLLPMGRQAGRLLAAILAGGVIRDLPPERPASFGYAFDPARMAQFGLTIPKNPDIEPAATAKPGD